MDNQISKAHSIVGVSKGRPDTDFYPTNPLATIELLRREEFSGEILEPCCGSGAISEVLKHKLPYSRVTSKDLYDYGYGDEIGVDFLEPNYRPIWYDSVITNPPYSLAEEFIRRSLLITKDKVAMLLKTTFLEGSNRFKLFTGTPLRTVYVFSGRLTLCRNGIKIKNSGMISYAWFVWEHGYQGTPMLDWILFDKTTKAEAISQIESMPNSDFLMSLV